MKNKIILISTAIILLILSTNFLNAGEQIISTAISEEEEEKNNQLEVVSDNQDHLILEEDSTVFHRETRKKELTVIDGDKEIVINDNYPSEPVISPDKSNLVYISPYEWETLGELYLYNSRNNSNELILDIDSMPQQNTVKQVKWINNDYLLAIVGYGMGTVSVGGNVYLIEVETTETEVFYTTEESQEVKNIEITGDKILFEIADFDEQYMDYEIIEKEFDKAEIINENDELEEKDYEEKYNNVQTQLELLLTAITPKNAEKAVETWARGITLRNGSLQFAVLSPELQEKSYELYSTVNWQPEIPDYYWINNYQISKIEEIDQNIKAYQVNFTFLNIFEDSYNVEVEVLAENQNDSWFVKSIESDSKNFYLNLSQ